MATGGQAMVGAVRNAGKTRQELKLKAETSICRRFEGTDLQAALKDWLEQLEVPVSFRTFGNVLIDMEAKGLGATNRADRGALYRVYNPLHFGDAWESIRRTAVCPDKTVNQAIVATWWRVKQTDGDGTVSYTGPRDAIPFSDSVRAELEGLPAQGADAAIGAEDLALQYNQREDRFDPGDISEEEYAYREDGEQDIQRGNVGRAYGPRIDGIISTGLTLPEVVDNVGDARRKLYDAVGQAWEINTDCPVHVKAIENELMMCFHYIDSYRVQG